jgi:hypothetical protein
VDATLTDEHRGAPHHARASRRSTAIAGRVRLVARTHEGRAGQGMSMTAVIVSARV